MKKNNVWEEIEKFDFDSPPSEYGFSVRLAYENGWSLNFTQKAIEEYKKFMFLASISKEMVSPSEIVDTVWHQHLLFSHFYANFCQKLGKWIDHVPSTHQVSEKHKFVQAKKHTQELYQEHFGKMPEDIWGNHTILDDLRNMAKSRISGQQINIVAFFMFILLFYPFQKLLEPAFLKISSSDFLLGYALLMILAGVGLWIFTIQYFQKEIASIIPQNPLLQDFHPLELIYMQKKRLVYVMHAITNELLRKGCIQIDAVNRLEINEKTVSLTFFEQIIYEYIHERRAVYYTDLVNHFISKPMFTQISKFVHDFEKVIFVSKMYLKYHIIKQTVYYIIFGLGLSRLFLGIERDKPVGYLIVLWMFFVIIRYIYNAHMNKLWVSRIIPEYYQTKEKDKLTSREGSKYLGWEYLTMGNSIIVTGFAPIITFYNHRQNKDGSNTSSCGSGCSSGGSCGSGCGGGCGGCGG
ncbi:MAG: hypothetical protein MUC49_19510 [Raineya sp.]|jgi:hypothetical protein|nr:hypothetical protein [Raineya sp.]